MSITGVPLSCFIYGICAEASFRGMIQSGPELLSHLRGEEPGSAILIATVFIFNMLAFANTAVFIPLLNLNENDCASLNTAGLVTWHAFFIIFDGFVMFKSYVCVRRNLYFKIICIIALLYRIGWTIADLMFTGGTWDSENQACVYAANFQTGLHYTIADIICDALSTVAAVYMMIQNREGLKGITSVFKEVMSENVVRSGLVLIVNAFVMYLNLYSTDLDLLTNVWGVQNYVYIWLMNMELFYRDNRRRKQYSQHQVSATSAASNRGKERQSRSASAH